MNRCGFIGREHKPPSAPTYMINEDRIQQIAVLVERLQVLLPQIGGRQEQTVVLGEQGLLRRSFHVFYVQAQMAEGDFTEI